MSKKRLLNNEVVFLNPQTCGVNKDGGTKYKVDRVTGKRGKEVDNELLAHVESFLASGSAEGMGTWPLKEVKKRKILVPRYYDRRWDDDFITLLETEGLEAITLGELQGQGVLTVRGGHGSPSNDQRLGTIPYVKVSDIRSLRVNVNPTNLIPQQLAERIWRSKESGLKAWDLITPNRASSNIGEFAILLPGEENIVVTKEVFVFRVSENSEGWDAFYLLWALCLRAVRRQWQRVTLMQTNREDVGARYKEIRVPVPKNKEWAMSVSESFREYFTTIAEAKRQFVENVKTSSYHYVANILTASPTVEPQAAEVEADEDDALEEAMGGNHS